MIVPVVGPVPEEVVVGVSVVSPPLYDGPAAVPRLHVAISRLHLVAQVEGVEAGLGLARAEDLLAARG